MKQSQKCVLTVQPANGVFNPAKQKAVCIVQDTADFFKYLCGVFEEVTIDIITEEVALARVNESNDMTEHAKSNVYISALLQLTHVSNCTSYWSN